MGVHLAALHCGVFLRPRDRLLKTDRDPLYGKSLIPRAFTRVRPPPPARCRTDPRNWAGQCLPRPPEMSVRDPSAGAEPVPPFRRLQMAPSRERTGNRMPGAAMAVNRPPANICEFRLASLRAHGSARSAAR